MAAEIAGEFQSQPVLTKGAGGVFIVTMDGKVLWDKKATGRFPDEGEITEIVKTQRR